MEVVVVGGVVVGGRSLSDGAYLGGALDVELLQLRQDVFAIGVPAMMAL